MHHPGEVGQRGRASCGEPALSRRLPRVRRSGGPLDPTRASDPALPRAGRLTTASARPRAADDARAHRARAPVAQGIEHRSPKAGVGSSNLPRRTACCCRSDPRRATRAPTLQSPCGARGQRVASHLSQDVDGLARTWTDASGRARSPAAPVGVCMPGRRRCGFTNAALPRRGRASALWTSTDQRAQLRREDCRGRESVDAFSLGAGTRTNPPRPLPSPMPSAWRRWWTQTQRVSCGVAGRRVGANRVPPREAAC